LRIARPLVLVHILALVALATSVMVSLALNATTVSLTLRLARLSPCAHKLALLLTCALAALATLAMVLLALKSMLALLSPLLALSLLTALALALVKPHAHVTEATLVMAATAPLSTYVKYPALAPRISTVFASLLAPVLLDATVVLATNSPLLLVSALPSTCATTPHSILVT